MSPRHSKSSPAIPEAELALLKALWDGGPATVRETGRLCYPSADRAVTALGHLWRRSRHLSRRNMVRP